MDETISIIIINHNLKIDTGDCIASLLAAHASLDQIRVVDNGSSDGSVGYLMERFGNGLTIVAATTNNGFPYAVNLGLKSALSTPADWFLIMNNDTLVAVDFLDELKNAIRKYPNYSLLGPMILYHVQPHRIWSLGDRLIPGTLATYHLNYGRDERQLALGDIIEVDFLSGCSMMVSREVVDKIGFFPEISLIYAEEVEYCWRARLAGFTSAIAPKARMWHKVSAVMSKQKPKTRYLKIRNQVNFYRNYSRGFQKPVMFMLTFMRSLGMTLRDLWQRQPELLGPLWRGWLDGWHGKMGDNVY